MKHFFTLCVTSRAVHQLSTLTLIIVLVSHSLIAIKFRREFLLLPLLLLFTVMPRVQRDTKHKAQNLARHSTTFNFTCLHACSFFSYISHPKTVSLIYTLYEFIIPFLFADVFIWLTYPYFSHPVRCVCVSAFACFCDFSFPFKFHILLIEKGFFIPSF